MRKVLNINASLYEITTTYPEIVPIIETLGFEAMIKPSVLKTEGRTTTIGDHAIRNKLDLNHIKKVLSTHDYDVRPL